MKPKTLTKSEIAQLEMKLGRPLTPREQLFGALERQKDKYTQYDEENWRVTMAKPDAPTTIYDEKLLEAKRQLREAKLQEMSSEERQVAFYEEARQNALSKMESKAQHEQTLQRIKPQLDELDKFQEQSRWEEAYDAGFVSLLDRTRQQLTTPGACLSTGLDMLDQLKRKSSEIRQAQKAKAEQLLQEVNQQLQQSKSQVDQWSDDPVDNRSGLEKLARKLNMWSDDLA